MNLNELIEHFEKFLRKENVSVQWAKDGETILDGLDQENELFDDIQKYFSLYRPEGGRHLYDKKQMEEFSRRIIPILKQLEKKKE